VPENSSEQAGKFQCLEYSPGRERQNASRDVNRSNAPGALQWHQVHSYRLRGQTFGDHEAAVITKPGGVKNDCTEYDSWRLRKLSHYDVHSYKDDDPMHSEAGAE
jgi:hypothetical protein